MNSTRFTVIALVLIGAGGLAIWRDHSDSEIKTDLAAKAPIPAVTVSEPAPSNLGKLGKIETPVQVPAASQPVPSLTKSNPTENAKLEFAHRTELQSYADVRKRVFLSDEAKKERKLLLHNRELLLSFEQLLNSPAKPQDLNEASLQASAIDLLIEAAQSGDSSTAEEVIKAVIQDAQIENESLSPQIRRELAGTKAELMYGWSAAVPGKSSEIAAMIPGPASAKIWENVQAVQEQNALESRTEAETIAKNK